LWNARVYKNIEHNDTELAIYHLPAQKTTGFKYYFDKVVIKNKDIDKVDLINIFDIKKNKTNLRKIKELNTKLLLKFL
jgi:hypothetical protein